MDKGYTNAEWKVLTQKLNRHCGVDSTYTAGFDINSKDTPSPLNASFQEPSVRVFQSPFDFQNVLVYIRAEVVSSGFPKQNKPPHNIVFMYKFEQEMYESKYQNLATKSKSLGQSRKKRSCTCVITVVQALFAADIPKFSFVPIYLFLCLK